MDHVVADSAWVDDREVAARFDEVYGAEVSKDTISRFAEKVTGELAITFAGRFQKTTH